MKEGIREREREREREKKCVRVCVCVCVCGVGWIGECVRMYVGVWMKERERKRGGRDKAKHID